MKKLLRDVQRGLLWPSGLREPAFEHDVKHSSADYNAHQRKALTKARTFSRRRMPLKLPLAA
jgi:hypothetical protein